MKLVSVVLLARNTCKNGSLFVVWNMIPPSNLVTGLWNDDRSDFFSSFERKLIDSVPVFFRTEKRNQTEMKAISSANKFQKLPAFQLELEWWKFSGTAQISSSDGSCPSLFHGCCIAFSPSFLGISHILNPKTQVKPSPHARCLRSGFQ